MLRIIVVDDEPRQRKGLVEIICRLRPEDEVIAMKDGEQVLEYVHDNEVDIVFSDIRMPQMSGLELSNRLLEADSEIIVILISVYADFEYAREALDLGAFGYLLKPVSVEELGRILNKAAAKRKERREQAFPEDEGRLLSALHIFKEHLLKRWLYGEIEEIELKGYVPDFRCGYLLYLSMPNAGESEIQEEMMGNASLWLKRYLENAWVFTFRERKDGNILTAVILLVDEKQEIAMVLDRFLRNMKKEYGEDISILASGSFDGRQILVSNVYKEFSRMKEILFYGPYGKVMYPEDCREKMVYGNGNLAGFSKHIRKQIMEEKGEEARTELERFFVDSGYEGMVRPDILKEITANLLLQVLDGLNEFITDEEREGLMIGCIRLKSCARYKELKEKSYGLLDKLAQYCQKGKLQVSPIRQAVRYIEEHYTEEMTLNSLAEMYHYSPNYFSSIFKAYTGETLISFVNRLRMEKAVEYMPVKNMKNIEIANRVGITDYKYFNKLFKKRYGMSVQKFRDQLLEKEKMPDE